MIVQYLRKFGFEQQDAAEEVILGALRYVYKTLESGMIYITKIALNL